MTILPTTTFLLALIFALSIVQVHSCSCAPIDFQLEYFRNRQLGTPISLAKVIGVKTVKKNVLSPLSSINKKIIYTLKVLKVGDGCFPRLPYRAFAVTSGSPGSCGVTLKKGFSYLLPLKKGAGKVSNIGLCGVNIQFEKVSQEQRKFVLSRVKCCRGRCQCADGKSPVKCIIPPCKFAKRPCAEAKKCINNFCGGCNAEWFDKNRLPACRPKPFPWRK